MALGASDPRRTHRNPHGGTSSLAKGDPIGTDDKGRVTLRQKAAALNPSTASVADIIRVLTEAGLMEE